MTICHCAANIKGALGMGNDKFQRFTRPMIDASFSYYPYMYAKGETALLWDDGKMDMAAERMIDGATKLNWGEFKAGAGEVWRSFLHKPLADPTREAEGQRRLLLDRSPPDIFDKTAAQMEAEKKKTTGWREHLVSGRPAEKSEKLLPKLLRLNPQAMPSRRR